MTTTWIIEWMQASTAVINGHSEVVLTAGWRCNVVQDTYTGTVYGTCSFPQPETGGTFTPYASLTQKQVLAWCWANGVDKEATEAALAAQIDLQKNPVQAAGVPWGA
jgi:hypothetical protein